MVPIPQDDHATIMIFRTYRSGSDVIALLPEVAADIAGRYCTCYQHIGQHGGADYQGVIRQSRPATAAESAPLRAELSRMGYRIAERRRRPRVRGRI